MTEPVVLVNPSAGGGRAGRRWEAAARRAAASTSFQVVRPDGRDGARRAVAEAVGRGAERIVVWGGDGTAHLVVGEVVRLGAGADVVVGLVPAGTGCDLARSLPIPRRRDPALLQALLGAPVSIDAGRCDSGSARFVFTNIASAGISGLVDEKVNAVPDRGAAAFLRATLAAFAAYRPVRTEVRVDGETVFDGDLMVAAVANGTTFGKGMRIAPEARVDDALLDVVVVGGISRAALARWLPQLYLGRHLHARPVTAVRGRTVELRCHGPLPPFDADGETYPGGDAVFEVLPGAWRLAGPRIE